MELSEGKQEQKKIIRKFPMFKSENLGSKMNDYLNLYLGTEGSNQEEVEK